MKDDEIFSRISKRKKIKKEDVVVIGKEIINEIIAVLETQEPVILRGFGEFYFRYQKESSNKPIKKSLKFRAIGYASELLENRSTCIGIKASDSLTLKQKGIDPQDIPKLVETAENLRIEGVINIRKFDGTINIQDIASEISRTIDRDFSEDVLEK